VTSLFWIEGGGGTEDCSFPFSVLERLYLEFFFLGRHPIFPDWIFVFFPVL